MAAPELLGGRYRISGILGHGGMATVYDGWDMRLGRPVAIKLLHPGLSANPEFRDRIAFEARSAAALNHPNIVVVHDSGEDFQRGGAPYLIMERLPGRSLLDAIAHGPLSPEQVRRVLSEVLAGLGAAHSAGILHRDIKPANVVFGGSGEAKIADFGVAKAGGHDLTQVGQVVGTMAYLSPQRISGAPATPLDDLYAVGAIGYEALTGRMPFPQQDPAALMHAITQHDLAPLLAVRPDVDPVLAAVIDRAMAPEEAGRFPNAEAMRVALNSQRPPTRVLVSPLAGAVPTMTGPPPHPPGRRKRTWAAFAVAAAVLLALVLVIVEAVGSRTDTSDTPTTPAPSVSSSSALPTASPTTTSPPPPTTAETIPEPPVNGHRNGSHGKPKHNENG
ncbi:MAG: serine/threonine-protein kinase [Mycobacterium sp.]